MRVGVLGGKGWLGSAIADSFDKEGDEYDVYVITRDNYDDYKGMHFDIFINAAGNKFNWWANKYPNEDFKDSAGLVYDTLYDFTIGKYVFLSSIAVYDPESHYGWNKEMAEKIIRRHANDYLNLRICHVIDKDMDVGVIYDMLNGKEVFLSPNSLIQLITKDALVGIIRVLVDYGRSETICVGGMTPFRLGDMDILIDRELHFKEDAPEREYMMNVKRLSFITAGLKTSFEYVKEIL